MPIPDIRIDIRDIGIREIGIPRNLTAESPLALPIYPPVTTEIGTPIVNIPGCVEAHKDSDKNTNLKNEDDKGTMTLCDAGTPSYYPIDYDANKLEITTEAPPPPAYKPPEAPATPEAPAPKVPKTEAPMPECPTRAQQLKDPIGKIVEGNKKLVAYEMVGKECLPVFEELSIPDQIVQNIPSPGMATATVAVAVTATSSALLAKPLVDLLLKAVKPTVKKVMKKIAALRGKKTQVESVKDHPRSAADSLTRDSRKLKGKE